MRGEATVLGYPSKKPQSTHKPLTTTKKRYRWYSQRLLLMLPDLHVTFAELRPSKTMHPRRRWLWLESPDNLRRST